MTTLPAAVDVEQTRLESLISLTWAPGHYSHACTCDTCNTTREHLAPSDLSFINHVSSTIGTKSVP